MPAIIRPVRGIMPVWGKDCFFADNAVVTGEVTMGDQCSIWFNAVVRGDVHYIRMGDQVNVQDGAVIHCTYQKAPTTIGSRVSIGHGAVIHGCTIEDEVLIGMGAIVMDGAIIRKGALVAAGAIVLEGTEVESDWLYAGIPAKKVKPLDDRLRAVFLRTANNYVMYAKWFEIEQPAQPAP